MHLIKQRDGHAWRGRFQAHKVIHRPGEIERDRAGRVMAAPSCYLLEHRHGLCPHGHRHEVREVADRNQIMDGWYNTILDNARAAVGAAGLEIAYVSGGTGAAARTADMAALGAETWREQWTERSEASATESVFYWYVSEAVPTQFFHEWGAWCGAATATLGSGVLVASWLLDDDHDSASSLNAQWTLSKA